MPTDNKINSMITELYETRRKRAELEKLEKAILEALKPLVDPKFDELPDAPIVVGDIEFRRSSGESRRVDPELLLERGVAPDIIMYASKVTRYFRYLTSKPKIKKGK